MIEEISSDGQKVSKRQLSDFFRNEKPVKTSTNQWFFLSPLQKNEQSINIVFY